MRGTFRTSLGDSWAGKGCGGCGEEAAGEGGRGVPFVVRHTPAGMGQPRATAIDPPSRSPAS
ncbi:hypothetical protein GCM10010504_17740 [Streptomyces griseus]|nr:hypothetical protein GCM10010504_17740 [Streptomyces griseus]